MMAVVACKEKKQPVSEPEPEPETTVVEEEPEPVEEAKPVRNEVQNYFLIAGCFEYENLAERLRDKLQSEGYDSRILPYFENLHLVTYNGYETRHEAVEALKEIRQEPGKEKTWLYKPKS